MQTAPGDNLEQLRGALLELDSHYWGKVELELDTHYLGMVQLELDAHYLGKVQLVHLDKVKLVHLDKVKDPYRVALLDTWQLISG